MRTAAITILTFLLIGLSACQDAPKQSQAIQASLIAPTPTLIPTHTPTVMERLENVSNVREAVSICSPAMGNTQDEDNVGGLCLALWGSKHFTWNTVSVQRDETSPGMVFKNSESQLGKRICTVGSVVEIHENSITTGEIHGFSGTLYHFYTVGSSGTIVENSTAHLCGFVVGVYSYSNSGGGTSHAIDLVGMWDLNYHPAESEY